MIFAYEKDVIIHIMKMIRFVLTIADSAYLLFSSRVGESNYILGVLMIENQPHITIEEDEKKIFNELIKSVDDLKLFLGKKFYKFPEA